MMEKPTRPVYPGPQASPAEMRKYAEENAACSEWNKEHPADLVADILAAEPGPAGIGSGDGDEEP